MRGFVILVLCSAISLASIAGELEFPFEPLKESGTSPGSKQDRVTLFSSEDEFEGDAFRTVQPETETKSIQSEEWAKKNGRDAQLWWKTYDTLLEVVALEGSKNWLLQGACEQIEAIITENRKILQNKRLSVFGEKSDLVTPLEAIIEAWDAHMQLGSEPKLRNMVSFMLKIDNGHEFRITGLRCLIRVNYVASYSLIKEALCNHLDLSNSPELITEIIDHWCVDNEPAVSAIPVSPKPIKHVTPNKRKKTLKERLLGKEKYAEVPSYINEDILPVQVASPSPKKITFREKSEKAQVHLFRVARLFVNKGAALTGLRDDFPPA